jgi:hypothetical protein
LRAGIHPGRKREILEDGTPFFVTKVKNCDRIERKKCIDWIILRSFFNFFTKEEKQHATRGGRFIYEKLSSCFCLEGEIEDKF